MATTTFLVYVPAVGDAESTIQVMIAETEGGDLSFKVRRSGSSMGNLRGMFLDVTDENMLSTLTIDSNIGNDSNKKLANGNYVNVSLGIVQDADAGIEADKSSIESNDINNYSFTLSSTKYKLSLRDFADVQPDHIPEVVMSCVDNSDGMILGGDKCEDLLDVVTDLPLDYFSRYAKTRTDEIDEYSNRWLDMSLISADYIYPIHLRIFLSGVPKLFLGSKCTLLRAAR